MSGRINWLVVALGVVVLALARMRAFGGEGGNSEKPQTFEEVAEPLGQPPLERPGPEGSTAACPQVIGLSPDGRGGISLRCPQRGCLHLHYLRRRKGVNVGRLLKRSTIMDIYSGSELTNNGPLEKEGSR